MKYFYGRDEIIISPILKKLNSSQGEVFILEWG